jgi:sulfur relay (sulfurtransferase) DsrF/TusC family protein
MGAAGDKRLALIVRGVPYGRRAPRADLDLALAAAALDFELEIYFIGESLLQLAAERDGAAAHLPPGYRAWAALPGLCKIRMFGEREWVRRCERGGIELAVPVEGLDPDSMRSSWRTSRRALVV